MHKHKRLVAITLSCILLITIGIQSYAESKSPMVAITFDDGPNKIPTIRILDTLEENGAKATFFVIGQNIQGREHILKRMQKMGCEVGNHTFNHKKMCQLSTAEIQEQFDKTDQAIQAVLGKAPALYRVPCGNCSHKEEIEKPIILWSIDTKDWTYGYDKKQNTPQNRKKVIDSVLDSVQDGDIILMHDIYTFTADCCEILIPALRAKGYRLVTVSELMRNRNVELLPGKAYHSAHEILEVVQETNRCG